MLDLKKEVSRGMSVSAFSICIMIGLHQLFHGETSSLRQVSYRRVYKGFNQYPKDSSIDIQQTSRQCSIEISETAHIKDSGKSHSFRFNSALLIWNSSQKNTPVIIRRKDDSMFTATERA